MLCQSGRFDNVGQIPRVELTAHRVQFVRPRCLVVVLNVQQWDLDLADFGILRRLLRVSTRLLVLCQRDDAAVLFLRVGWNL